MRRWIPAAMVLLTWACGPGAEDQVVTEADHDHENGAEEAHVVHLEPADVEAWGLVVETVRSTDIILEVELPGVLTTNGNRTARIASLVAGQLAQRTADLGSRVRQGETLASLNAPEFTRAQTHYLQAFAQAELSRRDYERARVLRERNAIEEREFLRRASVYEQQVAELRAAETILQSLGMGDEELAAITEGLNVEKPTFPCALQAPAW